MIKLRLYFVKFFAIFAIVFIGGGTLAATTMFTDLLFFTKPALAATKCSDPASVDPKCAKSKPIVTTKDQADKAGIQVRDANQAIVLVLNLVYSLIGIAAVIVIIIAGISITVADGDSSKVANARRQIIYAIVGLVIVGSAFIITGIVQGIGTK